MENKELILIEMVEKVQAEQREYYKLKAKFGNASQQLDLCKGLEKDLRNYCKQRRLEILEEERIKSLPPQQSSLF